MNSAKPASTEVRAKGGVSGGVRGWGLVRFGGALWVEGGERAAAAERYQ